MKRLVFIAVLLLISQTAFSQLYPVVHDADGVAIGNLVGFQTSESRRYVLMASLTGYLAMAYYTTAPGDGTETGVLGETIAKLYETDDCTGDPVVINRSRSYAASNYPPDTTGFFGHIKHRDILSDGGEVFYFPDDAAVEGIDIQSVFRYSCRKLDRCNLEDRQDYPQFLANRQVNDPSEHCPGDETTNPQTYVMVASGPRFSSLKPNDPAVTGFQFTDIKWPMGIKYVDINIILQDGFEAQTK